MFENYLHSTLGFYLLLLLEKVNTNQLLRKPWSFPLFDKILNWTKKCKIDPCSFFQIVFNKKIVHRFKSGNSHNTISKGRSFKRLFIS
jgi:hypothetical protein